MHMLTPEILAVLLPMIAIGVALAVLIMRVSSRLENRIDSYRKEAVEDRRAFQSRMDSYLKEAVEDRRAFQSRMDDFGRVAAEDRRALQSGMDDFRKEMQRLAERQSYVDGARALGPDPSPAAAG